MVYWYNNTVTARRLYLAHELLAENYPVIIPFKVMNCLYTT